MGKGEKSTDSCFRGCEQEIDESFKASFNGWNYNSLSKMTSRKEYSDIMTLIPLKLEAKHKSNVRTLCGDKHSLVKEHQLLFSDLKAYAGYYSRFNQHKKNKKPFSLYLKALEETIGKKVNNPIQFCKEKVKDLLKRESRLISKRNDSIIKTITSTKAKVVAVVIGNRHLDDLKVKLKKSGHKVQTIDLVQETLPKKGYLKELEAKLN